MVSSLLIGSSSQMAVRIYLFSLCGSAPGAINEYRDPFAGTLWTSGITDSCRVNSDDLVGSSPGLLHTGRSLMIRQSTSNC